MSTTQDTGIGFPLRRAAAVKRVASLSGTAASAGRRAQSARAADKALPERRQAEAAAAPYRPLLKASGLARGQPTAEPCGYAARSASVLAPRGSGCFPKLLGTSSLSRPLGATG
jgi:hypothetical protein